MCFLDLAAALPWQRGTGRVEGREAANCGRSGRVSVCGGEKFMMSDFSSQAVCSSPLPARFLLSFYIPHTDTRWQCGPHVYRG